MNNFSFTLGKALAMAVVTTAALGGCSMMCRACSGNKCAAKSSMQKCGACKAKCGACAAKP